MANNLRGVASAGGGFNRLSAGKKNYGGKSMPTVGPVMGKLGYAERDAKLKARNNALLRYGQRKLTQ